MMSSLLTNSFFILLLLVSALNAPDVFAGDDALAAFVEVDLLPKEAVAGQKRILQVDVFIKKWFVKAPRFPAIKIENAIVIAPKSFGVNSTEIRHGISYTKQRQEYLVFPAKQGAYLVKPFDIDLTLAPESLVRGSKPVLMSVTTPRMIFLVKPQATTALHIGSELPLVSQAVSLSQQFLNESNDGDDKFVYVGDVLERRISMRATETVVMSLPSFSGRDTKDVAVEEFDGYKVLRQISVVKDSLNRGELVAIRVETWQYVFSRVGAYQLPEMRFNYWQPEQQTFSELILPARNVTVRSSLPGELADEGAMAFRDSGKLWRIALYVGLVLVVLLSMLLTWLYILPRFKAASLLKQRFERYCQTSPSFFGQCVRYLTWSKQELKSWRLLMDSLDCEDAEFIIHTYYRWLASYEACNIAIANAELMQADLQRCISELYGRNGSVKILNVETGVLREDLVNLRCFLKHGVSKPALFKLQSKPQTLPTLNK